LQISFIDSQSRQTAVDSYRRHLAACAAPDDSLPTPGLFGGEGVKTYSDSYIFSGSQEPQTSESIPMCL